jgi:hypothetical protein
MKRQPKAVAVPDGVPVLSLDLDDPYLAPDAVWRSGRSYTRPYAKDGAVRQQQMGSVALQPITVTHVHAPAKPRKKAK